MPLGKWGDIVRPITLTQPIPNSYWATPNLVACEYPWAPLPNCKTSCTPPIDIRCPSLRKLIALILAGVRTFIDLTELKPSDIRCSYEPLLPGLAAALTQATGKVIQLNYYHVPIEDRSLPSKEAITKLLALLRSLEPKLISGQPASCSDPLQGRYWAHRHHRRLLPDILRSCQRWATSARHNQVRVAAR